jgi:hypothetical protein
VGPSGDLYHPQEGRGYGETTAERGGAHLSGVGLRQRLGVGQGIRGAGVTMRAFAYCFLFAVVTLTAAWLVTAGVELLRGCN